MFRHSGPQTGVNAARCAHLHDKKPFQNNVPRCKIVIIISIWRNLCVQETRLEMNNGCASFPPARLSLHPQISLKQPHVNTVVTEEENCSVVRGLKVGNSF